MENLTPVAASVSEVTTETTETKPPPYSVTEASGTSPPLQNGQAGAQYGQAGAQYGQAGAQYGQACQYPEKSALYGQEGPQYGQPYGSNPAVSHAVGTNQVVITTQPMQPGLVAVGDRAPPDYLAWSIVTTLCCCFFIGIAAIVTSMKSRDYSRAGDVKRAEQKSRTARNLNIAGLTIGLIAAVIIVVLRIVLPMFY